MSRSRHRLCLIAVLTAAAAGRASGPVDLPPNLGPRVPVAKYAGGPGVVDSVGNNQPYTRVKAGDTLHTRDVVMALPGFKGEIEPLNKAVKLTLWGNLPGLSATPVLESAVVLHDTGAFDLDLTLIAGRIVLTNTRAKGEAKIWLRGASGVRLVLPNPGDSVALEIYGRWPAGVPFSLKKKIGQEPVNLWEVHCLKGSLDIKADKAEYYMSAPPGAAYFHGDSLGGASPGGPEKRAKPPEWADPKAEVPPLAKKVQAVIDAYAGRLKAKEPYEIGQEVMKLAEKEADPDKARTMRTMIVHTLGATGEVEKVAELLNTSKYAEVRQAAVVALRHWIGARAGRDERMYENLQDLLNYSRTEADTFMQLLHSPFDARQPETFETLIAFLRHRKQSVRELAHWHLVRLAPVGKKIPYDASATAKERDEAVAAWVKIVPAGELPKDPDETK